MSTVKDDKIFDNKALKQAEQLAKAEAEKVGWFKKAMHLCTCGLMHPPPTPPPPPHFSQSGAID